MRKGPHPLSAHIGMMASALPGGGAADGHDFPQAMKDMLLGVQKYQQHPSEPRRPALHTVWRQGSVSLQSVHAGIPAAGGKPVLLLIPSMVNRAYILDLMEDRSLLRWLEGQGIVTLLLDWGEPVNDGDLVDIDRAVMKHLVPAVQYIAAEARSKIHVLGYCMGGTLLAGVAHYIAQHTHSLIFLAAPWDFHAGSQALLNRIKFWAPSATPLMEERHILPLGWIQTVFASLDPMSTARKFAGFAAMDPASPEAGIFVAVEDWLNDGVDLPAGIARAPIEEWFIGNRPFRGEWRIGGRTVHAGEIKCPALILTSKKDRLVEYDCAAALQAQIPGASLIDTGCGHIGMMAGRNAVKKAWEPLAAWIKKV